MKHMTEEELIAYREGVAEQRAVISEHLAACEECRVELERIEAVLAAKDPLFNMKNVPPSKAVLDRYVVWIEEYLRGKGNTEKMAGTVKARLQRFADRK